MTSQETPLDSIQNLITYCIPSNFQIFAALCIVSRFFIAFKLGPFFRFHFHKLDEKLQLLINLDNSKLSRLANFDKMKLYANGLRLSPALF